MTSSRSALVRPSLPPGTGLPRSRASCAIQSEMLWALGPNSRASPAGVRPAQANSTICYRNCSAYDGLVLGTLGLLSLNGKVSVKRGQIQVHGSESARTDVPRKSLLVELEAKFDLRSTDALGPSALFKRINITF